MVVWFIRLSVCIPGISVFRKVCRVGFCRTHRLLMDCYTMHDQQRSQRQPTAAADWFWFAGITEEASSMEKLAV